MTERKTPWTPGPWMLFNGTDVFPDDGDTTGARHIADCDPSKAPLASIYNDDGTYTYEDAVANARLIAAAPTIAEKAEAVMPSMVAAIDLFKAKGLLRCASDAQQALDDLKAALAAAKGGA